MPVKALRGLGGACGRGLSTSANPLGFGHECGKEQSQDTLTEQQLAAVYKALLAIEPIKGTGAVSVQTTYPIAWWV